LEDLVVGAELLDNHRELFVLELELLVKEILCSFFLLLVRFLVAAN
jgi:hypothetical protein